MYVFDPFEQFITLPLIIVPNPGFQFTLYNVIFWGLFSYLLVRLAIPIFTDLKYVVLLSIEHVVELGILAVYFLAVFLTLADFTITMAALCLFIILLTFRYTGYIISDFETQSLYAIPTALESHIFLAYIAVQSIIEKHIHVKFYQQAMFPIIFALGTFLLLLNLSGNLPLFLSLTSQFAIISAFVLPTVVGIFFWVLIERHITFLRTFYAPGTEIALAIILFPVELLTYFMRPISIICRLCSNIMSGHIIVKVCLQTIFALTQIKSSYNFFFSILITILILQLVPLLLLEVCVSLIQVYVFLVIFCMFLSDTFGHHYRY